MLAWLFWILAIIVASVLLVWAFPFAVAIATSELCPRCGRSLEISVRDRLFNNYIDPKYRSRAWDRCLRCGWRRSHDG